MGVLAATLEDAWQVASEIAVRAGGDPGYPGLAGPVRAPSAAKPQRLVFLETAGWWTASEEAKQALQDAMAQLADARIEIVTRQTDPQVAAVEEAIVDARPLSIADQRLGVALAPQYLSREGCRQVERCHARPPHTGGGDGP